MRSRRGGIVARLYRGHLYFWVSRFIGIGLALITGCERSTSAPHIQPNIVLISMDTTRANHLGCYGYSRDTTPNLDRLAHASLVFPKVYSTSSWTLPAHASLFTGKFVSSHGARYDPNGPLLLSNAFHGPEGMKAYRARGLSPEEQTLASILRDHGYATAAVVAGPWLKRVFGLDAGFDHYDDRGIEEVNGRLGSSVTDAALAWLDEKSTQPFFLFLNYFDAHYPYQPPPWIREQFPDAKIQDLSTLEARIKKTIALYDGEIRSMDIAIGRLLDRLDELGLTDNTWIIVTADHGELFGEHGLFAHGKSLSQEEIHVPLIIKPPKAVSWNPARNQTLSLVDVLPTVLDHLRIKSPSKIQGQPIGQIHHPMIAELYPLPALKRGNARQALIEGSWKLVAQEDKQPLLFDLNTDPSASTNLFKSSPVRGKAMLERLNTYLARLPKPRTSADKATETVDEETRRALESLGYIDTGTSPANQEQPK